jgi:hypothetical protein
MIPCLLVVVGLLVAIPSALGVAYQLVAGAVALAGLLRPKEGSK